MYFFKLWQIQLQKKPTLRPLKLWAPRFYGQFLKEWAFPLLHVVINLEIHKTH